MHFDLTFIHRLEMCQAWAVGHVFISILLWSVSDSLHPFIAPQSRIVNGIHTVTEEWPWVVSIRLEGTAYDGHLCGGSIIRRTKPAAILTAGHCIEWLDLIDTNRIKIWVDIGRDNVSSTNHYESYQMSTYTYHANISYDDYYQNTAIHDIGIIFIDTALPSAQQVISLNRENELMDGDRLITMGYGWDHTQTLTNTLKQAHVHYMNDTQCNIAIDQYFTAHWELQNYTLFLKAIGIEHGKLDEYPYNILQCKDCVLCALGNGSDACNGDSGSPLIKGTSKKNAVQVGIVSYGFECNIKDVPAQYTDVAFYYDWIQQQLVASFTSNRNDAGMTPKSVMSIFILVSLFLLF